MKRRLFTIALLTTGYSPWSGLYAYLPESYGAGVAIGSSGAGSAVNDTWSSMYYNVAGITAPGASAPSAPVENVAEGGAMEMPNGKNKPPVTQATMPTPNVPDISADDERKNYSNQIGLGLVFQLPQFYITPQTGSGSVALNNARIGADVKPYAVMQIGAVIDLRNWIKIPYDMPVRLGVLAFLLSDNNKVVEASEVSPKFYNFLMVGREPARPGAIIGLSIQPWKDRLSIGVGMNPGATANGTMTMTIAGNPDTEMDLKIKLEPAIVAGILYHHPLKSDQHLFLGLSYRGSNDVKGSVDMLTTLPITTQGIVVKTKVRAILYYSPESFMAAVSYQYKEAKYSLDLEYQRWSGYSLSDTEKIFYPEPRFNDIMIPKVGAEAPIHFGSWKKEFWSKVNLTGRAGYALIPSFTPDQTGLSNYLDNTKHAFSFGLTRFFLPNFILKTKTRLDFSFQWQYWNPRTSLKQGRELLPDGSMQPDYRYGGNLIITSIAATVLF